MKQMLPAENKLPSSGKSCEQWDGLETAGPEPCSAGCWHRGQVPTILDQLRAVVSPDHTVVQDFSGSRPDTLDQNPGAELGEGSEKASEETGLGSSPGKPSGRLEVAKEMGWKGGDRSQISEGLCPAGHGVWRVGLKPRQ